jgi:TPR repeat protein
MMKRFLFQKNISTFYKNYSKLTPKEAVEHFKLAEDLYEQKNYLNASKYYSKAAENGHKVFYFLFKIKESARSMGNLHALGLIGKPSLTDAEVWYSRAVELGDGISMGNLGSIYEKQGKIDKATEILKETIQKFDYPEASIQLGIIYFNKREFSKAKELFEKYETHPYAMVCKKKLNLS